jgi:hypothetical protein
LLKTKRQPTDSARATRAQQWGTLLSTQRIVPAFASAASQISISRTPGRTESSTTLKSTAFFAYGDIYLIGVKTGIIMDVEASRLAFSKIATTQLMIEQPRCQA